jgi:hypothetical protein
MGWMYIVWAWNIIHERHGCIHGVSFISLKLLIQVTHHAFLFAFWDSRFISSAQDLPMQFQSCSPFRFALLFFSSLFFLYANSGSGHTIHTSASARLILHRQIPFLGLEKLDFFGPRKVCLPFGLGYARRVSLLSMYDMFSTGRTLI